MRTEKTIPKNLLIRFNDLKLYEDLKEIAERESRSINRQIIHFLKRSVDSTKEVK